MAPSRPRRDSPGKKRLAANGTHGGDHPYVANWWPDAHLIGYEHTFTNEAYDFLCAIGGQTPTVPIPDFEDAYQTQRVLEAALLSASEKRWINLDDVK